MTVTKSQQSLPCQKSNIYKNKDRTAVYGSAPFVKFYFFELLTQLKQGPHGGIWQCAMCEIKTLFYNKDIVKSGLSVAGCGISHIVLVTFC